MHESEDISMEQSKIYKCTFLEEFNECPYYKSPNICKNEKTSCAFQESLGERQQVTSTGRPVYVRKPRWYESLPSRQKKR